MDEVIKVIQHIAKSEAEKVYTTLMGEVTAVFPHKADDDKENYQCSVKIKNKKQEDGSEFELRKVPICTSHIGLANSPNIGDLVLVSFIEGNINAPVVIGRMYTDVLRPPLSDKGEIVLENTDVISITTNAGTSIEIDKDGNINIEAAGKLSINEESQGEIAVFGNLIINEGSNGAARLDDEVEVEIPPGTFIEQVTGSAAGIPNVAPVKVTGKITSSSDSVKIGD